MNFEKKNVFVVIPAFNEADVISNVIFSVKKEGFDNIIIVDDGSQDKTYYNALDCGVISFRHCLNRGKGAAIRTGVEASLALGADIVVTMDGDGQHNSEDIEKMVNFIIEGKNDVVLGFRSLSLANMPQHKILVNYIGNIFIKIIYGLWVKDSQCGFRAYSKKSLKLIKTNFDNYAYDSEVIREIKKYKLNFTESRVDTLYTEYSVNKKQKQGLLNGFKALVKIIFYN
jgi:glycosyltransferase involved in cell wall biosynthesis